MSQSGYLACQSGVCGCCGASSENGYKHDGTCLINVPIAAMPLWRQGFVDFKAGKIKPTAPGPSGITYMLGVRCAENNQRKQDAELGLGLHHY